MVSIRTENQNQINISPFSLREVSVLTEFILGHLCCNLIDVPPQPNSPPGTVTNDDHLYNTLPNGSIVITLLSILE